MRFLTCSLCLLILPPLPVPLFALNLPRRLVAVAKALSGMVNINLHLRLLVQPSYSSSSSSTFSHVCRTGWRLWPLALLLPVATSES
jgi:hypothetical protein